MTIDTEKLEHEGIVRTETSKNSKLKEIVKLVKINGCKGLFGLIQRKEYREFQLKIGIEGKKADGKLGQVTLERLQHFIALENTNGQVLRNFMRSKKTKLAIEWTKTSEKSKLKEIISILSKETGDVEVDQLYSLLVNEKYQKFQETIGMKKEECDGKLGQATLARLKKYMDKIIQTPGKVKLEKSKDSTGKYGIYSYIVKKGGQPQHIRRECIRQLGCAIEGIKITDVDGKEYPENKNFIANDRVFIKVPLVESLEKMSSDTKEKIKIQEDYIDAEINEKISDIKITDAKGKEYPQDKDFHAGDTVYITLNGVSKIKYTIKIGGINQDIINEYKNEYIKEKKSYKKTLEKFNQQNPMSKDVEFSFAFPVDHYDDIEKTLYAITKNQTLDPKRFEVVILLNSPNKEVPIDAKVRKKILDFKKQYPEYNICLFEHTFNFELIKDKDGKEKYDTKYGTFYKLLGDTVIYRNLQRKNIEGMDMKKIRNLVMKTGGADSTDKNPEYLSKQLELYSKKSDGKELVRLMCDSRLPKNICEQYPLIEILEFFQRNFDNIYARGAVNRDIGVGTYKARMYCNVGGIKKGMSQQEDKDFGKRIRKNINESRTDCYLDYNPMVAAVDGSCDRGFRAMVKKGYAYCDRYVDISGNLECKQSDWNSIALRHKGEKKFLVLELTKKNLEYNLSAFYRQRINMILCGRQKSSKYNDYLHGKGQHASKEEKARWIAINIVNPIMEDVLRLPNFMGLNEADYRLSLDNNHIVENGSVKNGTVRVTLSDSAISKIKAIHQQKIKSGYYNYR